MLNSQTSIAQSRLNQTNKQDKNRCHQDQPIGLIPTTRQLSFFSGGSSWRGGELA